MYQEKKHILPVLKILKTYVELKAIRTNIFLLLNIVLYAKNFSKDSMFNSHLINKKSYDSELDLKSYFIYEYIKNQNNIDTFCEYKLDIHKKNLLDKYCTSLQIYHNIFLIFENFFENNRLVVKNNLDKKLYNNNDYNDYNIVGINNSNDFIDISTLNGIKLEYILKKYKKKYVGQNSTVSIHNISKKQKKIIEESIKYNICNHLIVKKIINKTIIDNKNYNHYKEVKVLKTLYKKAHFPIILSTNNNSLIMSYCGTKINNYNIPSDWKIQIDEIIKSLKSANIIKNNMWKNNFLVYNSIIYIINFNNSSDKIKFPYQNISESDIEYFDNFLQLLGNVYRRSIEL